MSALIINDIKKIARQAVEEVRLPAIGVGTIEEDGRVFIDANVEPYPQQAFNLPDSLKERKIPIELEIDSGSATSSDGATVELSGIKLTGTLTVKTGLKTGDRIYFLSQVGGQEFIVLGRSSDGDLTKEG